MKIRQSIWYQKLDDWLEGNKYFIVWYELDKKKGYIYVKSKTINFMLFEFLIKKSQHFTFTPYITNFKKISANDYYKMVRKSS